MTTATGNRNGGRESQAGNRKRHPPPGIRLHFPLPIADPPRAQRAAGFTLIEMLAVIVLLAIAVSVTAVALHGRSRGALNVAAQEIAAGLRDTRTRSMATGKPQWFTLDLGGRSFAAPGREPRRLPPDATLQVTSPAEGGAPGLARIGYFPDGSSSGGNITLGEDHRSLRVDVDWLTGAVTVGNGTVP